MTRSKLTAACAALALATAAGSTVRAATNSNLRIIAADGLSLSQPAPDQAASDGLLQTQMRERGWGGSWLEQYDLKLTGYVELGYTFNFDRPLQGNMGPGRQFDDKSDDPKFDQLSLELMRKAATSRDRFDTGFDVQVIYGADARYTQANGTNFYGSGYAGIRGFTFLPFQNGQSSPVIDEIRFPGQEFPENQIDILQANVSFNLPVGNGLMVKAGKFVTPWGVESIDPTKNLLYSHSFIFALSTPKTLTGATAAYQIDDQWGVMGGIVVGWDQSLEDNNDMPSFIAQGTYKMSDEWSFVLSGIVGPEKNDNRSDYRWLLDLTAKWNVQSDLTFAAEGVIGFEPGASFNRGRIFTQTPQLTFTGDDATWYGAALYAEYKWDEQGMLTLVGRAEWFSDGDGEWLIGSEVYSLSGGLIYRPFPTDEIGKNLMIRPEIRWDYCNDEIFDSLSRRSQITLGADLVFAF